MDITKFGDFNLEAKEEIKQTVNIKETTDTSEEVLEGNNDNVCGCNVVNEETTTENTTEESEYVNESLKSFDTFFIVEKKVEKSKKDEKTDESVKDFASFFEASKEKVEEKEETCEDCKKSECECETNEGLKSFESFI